VSETPETDALRKQIRALSDDGIGQGYGHVRDNQLAIVMPLLDAVDEILESSVSDLERRLRAARAEAEAEHAMDQQVVAQFRERAEAAERELNAITGDLDFKPDDQYKIADMANVGHAFMREIAANIPKYCYNDSPAEIICELLDKVTDAERELAELKSAMDAARWELPVVVWISEAGLKHLTDGHMPSVLTIETRQYSTPLCRQDAAASAIASRDLRIRGLEADVKLLDWIQENHRAQAITEYDASGVVTLAFKTPVVGSCASLRDRLIAAIASTGSEGAKG